MGAALMGATCAARLMLFVGGPSTCGSGKIVDTELAEAIRSHKVTAPSALRTRGVKLRIAHLQAQSVTLLAVKESILRLLVLWQETVYLAS